ncbi:MAG TPA: alpha/beta hydrolase [Solirubrobacterales bacterium]|nr:alpha/beta hydrolase [Solirubrobacterales bacterium]
MLIQREILRVNGVELCVEAIGEEADPALLLIMGAQASMDWWEDEFCERLAAGGRRAIRYDQRDTGQSTSYEPGAPAYTYRDLVDDAIGILDVLEVERGHVAAMSMGGGAAQLIALDHPDRVSSLTLIATAPAPPGPADPDLPTMSEDARARFAAIEEPDWTDRRAVIEYGVETARASVGDPATFDEQRMRALWDRVLDRTTNIAATMANHFEIEGPGRIRERLGDIDVPTLVIHGRQDPFIPFGNGEALAREIPGARLLALDDVGHELPQSSWDIVVPALLEHTA